MSSAPAPALPSAGGSLTAVQWLICIIAVIGFAFDTYVLLMLPLILGPARGILAFRTSHRRNLQHWAGSCFLCRQLWVD